MQGKIFIDGLSGAYILDCLAFIHRQEQNLALFGARVEGTSKGNRISHQALVRNLGPGSF